MHCAYCHNETQQGLGQGDGLGIMKDGRYMEGLEEHVLLSEKLLDAFQNGVLLRVCGSVL